MNRYYECTPLGANSRSFGSDERRFYRGEKYDEATLRQYFDDAQLAQNFTLLSEGPPDCDDIGTISELIERCEQLRDWMNTPLGKQVGWEPVAPLIDQLVEKSIRLGRSERPDTNFQDESDALAALNGVLEWAESKWSPPGDKQRQSKEQPLKRTGRPVKGETGRDMLVVAALAKHHNYRSGGSIGNYTPASVRGMCEAYNKEAGSSKPHLTTAAVTRFFQKQFGADRGHKGYVAACNKNAPVTIGMLLAKWQDELPSQQPTLTDDECGRGWED